MTTETGLQPAPNGGVPPPAADPDEAKYAELRKELGMEEGGEQEPPEPPASEPKEGEPEPPPEPEKAKPQHVPYAEHENVQKALREAREAAKASDERFNQVMRLIQQSRAQSHQEPPKKDEPEPLTKPTVAMEADPMAWLEYLAKHNEQLETQLKETRQGTQLTGQQLQAYQQQQQLWSTVQASEAEIVKEKPDYWDACQHLEGQRIRELDRMYPDASPYAMQAARQQGFASPQELKLAILDHDRQSVAVQAVQLGQSPAQVYYDLAVDRGYTPKAAQQQQQPDRGKQQLEAAKRGQAASISLSGGEGTRKGANDMSITDLADLFVEDPDMADKVWDQMARAGRLG